MARSAAELLTSAELPRVSQSPGEACGWLFLDASRNRSRRWCHMSDCGNRAKAALERLPEALLDAPVGSGRDRTLGSGVAYYRMLHGIVQHDAYHSGQIALLKKAAGQA